MKKLILLLVIAVFAMNSGNAAIHKTEKVFNSDEKTLFQSLNVQNLNDFVKLTPKQIKEQTGRRLSLKEVITLKAAQKVVKSKFLANNSAAGDKSQLIALILCVALGGLGIHRFYLGYTWQGVVQLLTLGGCGIWALIDLIMIITGDLQPKNGTYNPKL
jgi:TM2 domain-containing membrane protein YozV